LKERYQFTDTALFLLTGKGDPLFLQEGAPGVKIQLLIAFSKETSLFFPVLPSMRKPWKLSAELEILGTGKFEAIALTFPPKSYILAQ
jgi:hypothetical protein